MAINFDGFSRSVQQGFAKAAISTTEGLKNDELVKTAARNIYDVIPFPANVAIKMSVGIEGLERLALTFRDVVLASGITDLTKLGPDEWKALLRRSLNVVPGLAALVAIVDRPGASAAASLSAEAKPPAKTWFLMRGATRYGPWSDQEFLGFAQEGRFERSDRVWRDGFADWVELGQLPQVVSTGTGLKPLR